MSNAPRSRHALQWLAQPAQRGGTGLMRLAQDLAKLQADIDHWCAGSRLRLAAGPLKQGHLRLFTDHPAMLARARQQMPSLQQHLNQRGWGIGTIDLKVRSRPQDAPSNQQTKRGHFGESARENWVELAEKLSDERLRAAAKRLCERNGWTS